MKIYRNYLIRDKETKIKLIEILQSIRALLKKFIKRFTLKERKKFKSNTFNNLIILQQLLCEIIIIQIEKKKKTFKCKSCFCRISLTI